MRIGVVGCAGRMGRTLLREVLAAEDLELAGGVEAPGHAAVGRDLGELAGVASLGLQVGTDVAALARAADVLVEFTLPEPTLEHLRLAAQVGTPMVIGTTGFDAAQRSELEALARAIPVVWAPNMSQGVNLLLALVETVARTLGGDFDIEILEMHHRHKVDAPSGTALALGEAAARGRGVVLDQVRVDVRSGHTGPRPEGAIGFAVLRGGDVVGEHVVVFAGEGERLELGHRATDRRIFARGALRAARWLAGRSPGLYGMRHVLGL